MTVFDRVKKVADIKGLSIQKVAIKAGLGINSIYSWKERDPSLSRVEKVAKVLDVTPNYLLGKEDHSSNVPVDLLDGVRMYGGKPVDDQEKAMIKALLDTYRKGDD